MFVESKHAKKVLSHSSGLVDLIYNQSVGNKQFWTFYSADKVRPLRKASWLAQDSFNFPEE